ncbi:unnamed protein product [Ectocarpus sp. CCAP 1310/34]|nr:unnamed protein product [Ectocarpus sp. CCAP 1310/34]
MGIARLVIDALILVFSSAYALISLGYVATMWHLRKNFFIVLRSPILACTSGLGITVRYIVTIYGLVLGRNLEILNLIGFPALLIAEIAVILTALRLFVMYYPSTRAKYGRVTREKPWACGLAATYLLVEMVVWLAAAMQGTKRVAVVMTNLAPLSAFVTLMAVVCLGRQLKRIHDLSNMGRDIRLVGIILLICLPVFTAIRVLWGSILAFKYFFVIFITISHPPIVWILNIRPIQEVLHHAPRNSIPKGVQVLLALSSRRRGGITSTIVGEAVTPDVSQNPSRHSRESYVESNRLAGIMNYLPLREAFGEFCQKSLCSESFQFLLDASEFRGVIVEGPVDGDANGSAEEENEAPTHTSGLGDVATMVNEYIKDGAPSEINIGSDTKRDIMELAKVEAFASLDQDARLLIFVQAEREIRRILEDNLMARFLASAQYKRAVDGDGHGRV